jgi:hypothetical protein
MSVWPMIAARHLDANAAPIKEIVRRLADERTADTKSTRVGINHKGCDPAQPTWRVEKLVSMSTQAANNPFILDCYKHGFIGRARKHFELIGYQVRSGGIT